MKIYGQTDELIVREMIKRDLTDFLKIMEEHGNNEDFTVDDIYNLWKFRKQKGDIQCTIVNRYGDTVYGFCGILHSQADNPQIRISFFDKYHRNEYEIQAKTIMESFA